MEPEGSLPDSQASAISPYPEPNQSSPCHPFHFLKINFNIVLPSMPRSAGSRPLLSIYTAPSFPCDTHTHTHTHTHTYIVKAIFVRVEFYAVETRLSP
jgi:hypothetical protein